MKENFLKKKQKLRNNEYYNMQDVMDMLYEKSKQGKKFNKLMDYITCKENILLAYRNIKKNTGSKTCGTDGLTIKYFEDMCEEDFVKRIQNKLKNYKPKSVRRVEIPKPNGKKRPLGIPCIEDRVIQQCIKQILEPICEAKFHKHSYGFRPNRSTEHAIARSMTLMNLSDFHYVVDIDIEGFFDNVNHAKLKKQIWNLGIQDKTLIAILGKILKSEIEGVGVPSKGTPQGGIISPLLSNIVLNELDWWISSQWETFETKKTYSARNKYQFMRKTGLKEFFIVRYADDFKIFCKNPKTAFKIFNATRLWLKERLNLEISKEKSKVTNLRKNYTEFLGLKLKAKLKKNKYICYSRMSDKSKKATIKKIKEQISKIKETTKPNEVNRLNAIILGSHNYYKMATHVNLDFANIDFLVKKTLYHKLRCVMSTKPEKTKTYNKLYGDYDGMVYTVAKITIFPIYGCKNKPPMNFSQEITNYTVKGRELIHKNTTSKYGEIINYLLRNTDKGISTELSDNRISLIAGQKGMCYVTGIPLKISNMECHHKKQKCDGGTDEYSNLVWVISDVHKLIHATVEDTINKYLRKLKLSEKALKRVNSLRKLVGNSII